MKIRKLTRVAIASLLLSTLNSQRSTTFAQGSLTPPGAPAPTMKTLDQIEARTPISSVPYIINSSGSYYLTTNVTATVSNAITIAVNNVTLDLNGFTIASTAASAAGTAILLSGTRTNIAIYNGHVSSGVSVTGGVFGGSGFGNGIYYSGNSPFNVRVKDVFVAGVLNHGIYLGIGNSTVVESCTVNVAGSYGIYAASVSDSSAVNGGTYGIFGYTTHNCKGHVVAAGLGLYATTANNCYGQSTVSGGGGLAAATANNCYGKCVGVGSGLSASIANNCYGEGSGSGFGLNATIANNCYGECVSGEGLVVSIANNCYGFSSSGTGLRATEAASNCRGYTSGAGFGIDAGNASNCRGDSSSGTGVRAAYTASFCSGVSTTGTGVSATIAIGCTASSVSATYRYLMP